MKFGVFDHLDQSGRPAHAFYEDRLRLLEAYDRAGMHSYHTAEHHATPLGMCPSPSVFHSAIAQRTKRILFGPLVYTLNLYHPLRLAEEICMLDHLSGGRFQLGIGRGISPYELRYFGADPDVGQAMYIEAFQVITKALAIESAPGALPPGTSDPGGTDVHRPLGWLTHEGKHYQFRDVPIYLAPLQRPHPPLWYGIGNPESVPWAVANRVNLLANAPPALMQTITSEYRKAWAATGQPASAMPYMGTTRHMVIARTDAEAMAIGRRAYALWYASFMYLFRLHAGRPRFLTFSETWDELVATGQAICGAPATARRQLAEQIDAAGVNYFMTRMAFGDLTLDESLASLELFVKEVRPAFADA